MLYLKTPSKLVLCHFEILSHCHTFGPLIYGMTHLRKKKQQSVLFREVKSLPGII